VRKWKSRLEVLQEKKAIKLINMIYSDWVRNKSSRFFYLKKENRRLGLEYGRFKRKRYEKYNS
jgi:hypothetical protein